MVAGREVTVGETKYASREKAQEYALMSWPEFCRNARSEPFYQRVSTLITQVSHSSHVPGTDFIEIGYGAGRLAFALATARPDATVHGYEISTHMKDISEALVTKETVYTIHDSRMKGKGVTNVRFHAPADIQQLSAVAEHAADFVVCVNVIDRVRHTTAAVSELLRIVENRGCLLLVTACDYEAYTPPHERLSPNDVRSLVKRENHAILHEERLQLHKLLENGATKTFDEVLFVIQKRKHFTGDQRRSSSATVRIEDGSYP